MSKDTEVCKSILCDSRGCGVIPQSSPSLYGACHLQCPAQHHKCCSVSDGSVLCSLVKKLWEVKAIPTATSPRLSSDAQSALLLGEKIPAAPGG